MAEELKDINQLILTNQIEGIREILNQSAESIWENALKNYTISLLKNTDQYRSNPTVKMYVDTGNQLLSSTDYVKMCRNFLASS